MSQSDGWIWPVLQDQVVEIEMVWTPGRQLRSTGATHRGIGEQRAQTIDSIPGQMACIYRLHPPGTVAS